MAWCGSAAGNDDATKVGAFGVGEYPSVVRWFGKADPPPPGFYSVLSKSDRPLVRSNGTYVSSIVIQGKVAIIHAFVQENHCNFTGGKGRLVLGVLLQTH